MAIIKPIQTRTDETPAAATHELADGRGNVALGHFDASYVPSFQVGTRIADLAFVIDAVAITTRPPQSAESTLQVLRGPEM